MSSIGTRSTRSSSANITAESSPKKTVGDSENIGRRTSSRLQKTSESDTNISDGSTSKRTKLITAPNNSQEMDKNLLSSRPKRSCSRLSQTSSTNEESSYNGMKGQNYSSQPGVTLDFAKPCDSEENEILPARPKRSSSRLSQAAEDPDNVSVLQLAQGRSSRISRILDSLENVPTPPRRRSSSRLSQISETESVESCSNITTRRYGTRSRKVDDDNKTVDTRPSSRLSQFSGSGSMENLSGTDKPITTRTTRSSKRKSNESEAKVLSDIIYINSDEESDSSVSAVVKAPENKRETQRLSNRIKTLEDIQEVPDESAVTRRSTRLRKDSETSETNEKATPVKGRNRRSMAPSALDKISDEEEIEDERPLKAKDKTEETVASHFSELNSFEREGEKEKKERMGKGVLESQETKLEPVKNSENQLYGLISSEISRVSSTESLAHSDGEPEFQSTSKEKQQSRSEDKVVKSLNVSHTDSNKIEKESSQDHKQPNIKECIIDLIDINTQNFHSNTSDFSSVENTDQSSLCSSALNDQNDKSVETNRFNDENDGKSVSKSPEKQSPSKLVEKKFRLDSISINSSTKSLEDKSVTLSSSKKMLLSTRSSSPSEMNSEKISSPKKQASAEKGRQISENSPRYVVALSSCKREISCLEPPSQTNKTDETISSTNYPASIKTPTKEHQKETEIIDSVPNKLKEGTYESQTDTDTVKSTNVFSEEVQSSISQVSAANYEIDTNMTEDSKKEMKEDQLPKLLDAAQEKSQCESVKALSKDTVVKDEEKACARDDLASEDQELVLPDLAESDDENQIQNQDSDSDDPELISLNYSIDDNSEVSNDFLSNNAEELSVKNSAIENSIQNDGPVTIETGVKSQSPQIIKEIPSKDSSKTKINLCEVNEASDEDASEIKKDESSNVSNDESEEVSIKDKSLSTVEKENQNSKRVSFSDDTLKPKKSKKSTLALLNDPQYVSKINDYINDVLLSRQKLKEISKFDDVKNHKKHVKKIEKPCVSVAHCFSAPLKDKSNLDKLTKTSNNKKDNDKLLQSTLKTNSAQAGKKSGSKQSNSEESVRRIQESSKQSGKNSASEMKLPPQFTKVSAVSVHKIQPDKRELPKEKSTMKRNAEENVTSDNKKQKRTLLALELEAPEVSARTVPSKLKKLKHEKSFNIDHVAQKLDKSVQDVGSKISATKTVTNSENSLFKKRNKISVVSVKSKEEAKKLKIVKASCSKFIVKSPLQNSKVVTKSSASDPVNKWEVKPAMHSKSETQIKKTRAPQGFIVTSNSLKSDKTGEAKNLSIISVGKTSVKPETSRKLPDFLSVANFTKSSGSNLNLILPKAEEIKKKKKKRNNKKQKAFLNENDTPVNLMKNLADNFVEKNKNSTVKKFSEISDSMASSTLKLNGNEHSEVVEPVRKEVSSSPLINQAKELKRLNKARKLSAQDIFSKKTKIDSNWTSKDSSLSFPLHENKTSVSFEASRIEGMLNTSLTWQNSSRLDLQRKL